MSKEMKKRKANADTTAVKLQGNIRIRAEAPAKARKRVDNALLRNQVLAGQQAAQYKLELQRLDAALHTQPAQLQRAHVLMGRGQLQSKHDSLKIA